MATVLAETVALAKTVAPKSSSHLAEIITFLKKNKSKKTKKKQKKTSLPQTATDTSLSAD